MRGVIFEPERRAINYEQKKGKSHRATTQQSKALMEKASFN